MIKSASDVTVTAGPAAAARASWHEPRKSHVGSETESKSPARRTRRSRGRRGRRISLEGPGWTGDSDDSDHAVKVTFPASRRDRRSRVRRGRVAQACTVLAPRPASGARRLPGRHGHWHGDIRRSRSRPRPAGHSGGPHIHRTMV
jgi:hypothetical protein